MVADCCSDDVRLLFVVLLFGIRGLFILLVCLMFVCWLFIAGLLFVCCSFVMSVARVVFVQWTRISRHSIFMAPEG